MTRGRRRPLWVVGALLGLLSTSCGPGPVTVLNGLEIVVAEGDGQFGAVGQMLGTPLRAVVRNEVTSEPQEGVSVHWDILEGGATLVGAAAASSDSTGSIQVRVQLGDVANQVVIRATITAQPDASATFTLHIVEPPVLSDVSPVSLAAGDTVTLRGANFSPVPVQNVVLFSGIRGRVLSATGTELKVEVPRCLPARAVSVKVQLGVVATSSMALTVTGGGTTTQLAVGQVLDVADGGGFPCYALQGGSGVEYLTLVYSASTVGAAMHPYVLTALSSSSPAGVTGQALRTVQSPSRGAPMADPQALWDERLRAMEGELWAARDPERVAGAARAAQGPAAAPMVGERRTFNVLTLEGTYDQVMAEAEYVGAQVAIFVDDDAPAGGFTVADLQAFAERFDDVIHPEVTAAFGVTSDLDTNQRVIILFTPGVNRLTPRGASGFVGGFFFGNDLLPQTSGSNRGEVFYALVPDPTGQFGDARTKGQVQSVVPGVLAHEFQHMVHFNERYLRLRAGQEALWLSEALAQMAEEIVARRYEALADAASTELFRTGTRARARRYLAGPESVSIIVSTGQGSLEERGGGYLHVLYLADQEGIDVLGRLTATTRTGVANVEAELVNDWSDILADWWSAILLDGPGPETGPLVYPTVHLRALFGNQFPLAPRRVGPADATRSGLLWSSSAAYTIVSPEPTGSMTVRLGGEAGGSSSPQAALRMRIIRLR